MANIIIVTGPQAVGKMTVAKKIAEQTGYRIMTNHNSIELSDVIFERGTKAQRELSDSIREAAFDIATKYNIDFIFTFVTAFDQKSDIDYLNKIKEKFEKTGGTFYFVELRTDLETRLQRNTTPERLKEKPTKRDVIRSEKDLLETHQKYKLNTEDDEFLFTHHIKIDNTNLEPEAVATTVVEYIKSHEKKI